MDVLSWAAGLIAGLAQPSLRRAIAIGLTVSIAIRAPTSTSSPTSPGATTCRRTSSARSPCSRSPRRWRASATSSVRLGRSRGGDGMNGNRLVALALAAVLGVTAGACGDDGDGDLATWCRLGGEINGALGEGEAVADETYDEFTEAAPGDIRAASQEAAEAFKASPEGAFEDPDVQAAVEEIEAFNEENC